MTSAIRLILLSLMLATGCASLKSACYDYCKPEPEPPDPALDLPDGTRWINCRQQIDDWAETITIHNVQIHYGADKITVKYDRLPEIPAWNVPGDKNNVHNVNGSIWLVRQFQGQWYIGTFEYLRVGQETKEFLNYAPQFKFTPKTGDRIGIMVSTMARNEPGTVVHGDPNSPYRERSAIYWMNFGE